MSEYDLVCDICAKPLTPRDSMVTWVEAGGSESHFALVHTACAPADANGRREVRWLIAPNGYLAFVGERIGKRNDDPDALRAILAALAPFVMRPDNPSEMDSMRAASFGAEVGVKFGTTGQAKAGVKDTEGGK